MRKFSVVWFFVILALIFASIHFYTGWENYVSDAAQHGETALMGDYVIKWMEMTFENLQSEVWQLALQFLVLGGALKMFGIKPYEEDQEEIKARLDRLERK